MSFASLRQAAGSSPLRARHLAVAGWFLLVTMLVKVDGEEGLFPFFRVCLFAALPFALFHFSCIAVSNVRGSARQWVMFVALVWLLVYPFLTMAFGTANERNLKDAAYTIAIYLVIFWMVRVAFVTRGRLDVDAFGRVAVVLAVIEAALALVLRAGVALDLGFGIRFVQQPWLDGRLHGIIGTPTHLAPVLGTGILFLITKKPTVGRSMTLGFLVMCLVMTGSRSSLLALTAAAVVYALVHALELQVSRQRLVQCAAVIAGVLLVALVFWERTAAVLEIAFRVDPPDWEKNRFVMWSARLAELYGRDMVQQLFGAGHRAVGQTFNINVEFLTNYGLLYAAAFTAVYAEMVLTLFKRALAGRDAAATFLLMLVVFTYVFSQGLNFILHQFVSAIHVALVVVVIGYLERIAVAPARAPEPQMDPAPRLGPGDGVPVGGVAG